MQWTGNRVTGRRDNKGMKTRYRGRGVPVLNEMIRIDLTELFKHIRDGNCFFFFFMKLCRAHYTWIVLGKMTG